MQTISISPRNVFGIRVDVKGNINYTTKEEVMYPVAGVLSIHDFKTGDQKFLRFADHSQPEIIAMSPNRKLFAVAERHEKYTFASHATNRNLVPFLNNIIYTDLG